MSAYRDIAYNSLWKQNPILGQVLGLCPTLAITTSLISSFSLGLATALVMAISNFAVSALRSFIPYEVRIPIFILIIAALVTVVDLAMNAWLHDLYLVLGIFIPLIVTNCIVLARVEAFAAKNEPLGSTLDGIAQGAGLTLVLVVLGALREFVGSGTLLSGIEMIIPGASPIVLFGDDYPGFLVAILPPGAFFALGSLVAGRNWLEARKAARARQAPPSIDTPVEAG
ncbi:MAG TPA: electron transport complex subunit E [Rhodocyclaceae bacterium]|nr:electron transport complex subunit E [Rhodocyclaceae bacterium]